MNSIKNAEAIIFSMKVRLVQDDINFSRKKITIKKESCIEIEDTNFAELPQNYQYLFEKVSDSNIYKFSKIYDKYFADKIRTFEKEFEVSIDITICKDSIFQIVLTDYATTKNKKFDYANSYYSITCNIYHENILISSRDRNFRNLGKKSIFKFFNELEEELHFHVCTPKERINIVEYDNFMFGSEPAAYFIHEGIGHFLECDYYKISPLQHSNETFSGLSIYENVSNRALKKDQMGDGIIEKCPLIDNGIVTNLLSNRFYSDLYKIPNSGNAIFEFNPLLVRMRSMRVVMDTYEANIPENTLIIEDIVSGDMNPLFGYFSIVILRAKNTRGNYFSPFTLHFNIEEFKNYRVFSVGEHIKYLGKCGKFNEVIPVEIEVPPFLMRKE